MALSTYTTYDQVRAVLGVSHEELEDEVLSLGTYEDMLRLELDSVNLGIHSTYVTLKAATSPSDAEEVFLRYFRLFSTYAVARALVSSLPMFAPKSIGDGKAYVTRFSDSPFKATSERVEREFARLRTLLESAYATLQNASATVYSRPWFSVSSPSVDPVTGV